MIEPKAKINPLKPSYFSYYFVIIETKKQEQLVNEGAPYVFSVTIALSQGEKGKHRLSRGLHELILKVLVWIERFLGGEQLTLTVMNGAGDSVLQMNPISLVKWTVRFPYRLSIIKKSWENSNVNYLTLQILKHNFHIIKFFPKS